MPARDRGIALAFARARAGDRRLGPWMTRHHDELLRELGTGRIEWASPLAVFASLGLTDEHGRAPTRDTASRTWQRVRIAVTAARRAEVRTLPRMGEIAPGVRLVPPVEPPYHRQGSAPAAPVPTARPPAPAPEGAEEATERIRSVLDAMGAARVPLPRQPSRTSPPAAARPAHDRTCDP